MREEKRITHPSHLVEEWVSCEIEYHCDGCGKLISKEDPGNDYAHELAIGLDMEECVSFYRRRDLCPSCMEPAWAAINQLLGTDPDAERDREYEWNSG